MAKLARPRMIAVVVHDDIYPLHIYPDAAHEVRQRGYKVVLVTTALKGWVVSQTKTYYEAVQRRRRWALRVQKRLGDLIVCEACCASELKKLQ